ncbi:MAG: ATP-binding cassette domain-containing protein [Bacteriovorax sp.]|nr:ATP-binding cassette domain-containing protein [Bacteriovorax sp.]
MIICQNVGLRYGARKLFEDVDIKFTPGNCYGLIGANGAGKSTFLKILSGEIPTSTGNVFITPGQRLSVLKQDHFLYEDIEVLKVVIMGNKKLLEVMEEKDALYAKEDFSDEDGLRAADLEAAFAEMNGWEAESEAAVLLSGLGIKEELLTKKMSELSGGEKVKVLLAQALFGKPDILLLDEPTNHLDMKAIHWLENFLAEFQNTVIVVSHDRHFLNKVCTHMADIDFGKIQIYTGNYDFWYQSSQLALTLKSNQNKKTEEKIKELKDFIARFSANASKSKQATSRQKMLEKITLEDIQPSTRKYPFVHFKAKKDIGKDVLNVEKLSLSIEGKVLFKNISFQARKTDKIVLLGSDQACGALMDVLAGVLKPDSGTVTWGVTAQRSYFPSDNSPFFAEGKYNLVDWLRDFSEDKDESFVRGFLGRMLFSGEEALKKTNVLSGGEKVRMMLSKMMLEAPNVLIMDGPTNHLDLESITSVNEGLKKYDSTILFACHDHEFVQTVANRIIDIQANGSIIDVEKTFDEYLGLN